MGSFNLARLPRISGHVSLPIRRLKIATKDAEMQVNILEAKNQLSRLIRIAQSGEEVIIANRGEPVARLVAAAPPASGPHPKGSAAALLAWLEANPLPPRLRRSHESIEADIAAERAAWD